MKLYITYEEPFANRKFNSNQMYEVYRDMADKAEYPSFDGLRICSKVEFLQNYKSLLFRRIKLWTLTTRIIQ